MSGHLPRPHPHPHQHRSLLALPTPLRRCALSCGLLSFVSGGTWMVLHYFFQQPSEFGLQPHPLEPSLIRIHGITALAAIFLFGWISSRHVVEALRRSARRYSGITLLSLCALSVISGYALFYLTNDSWHQGSSVLHQVSGVLLFATGLVHILKRKHLRRASA